MSGLLQLKLNGKIIKQISRKQNSLVFAHIKIDTINFNEKTRENNVGFTPHKSRFVKVITKIAFSFVLSVVYMVFGAIKKGRLGKDVL